MGVCHTTHWPTESGRSQTHQTASGKEATQIDFGSSRRLHNSLLKRPGDANPTPARTNLRVKCQTSRENRFARTLMIHHSNNWNSPTESAGMPSHFHAPSHSLSSSLSLSPLPPFSPLSLCLSLSLPPQSPPSLPPFVSWPIRQRLVQGCLLQQWKET